MTSAGVSTVFTDHTALLRAVVRVSGALPQVVRRGQVYAEALTKALAAAVAALGPALRSADPLAAVRISFSTVFAAHGTA